MAGGVLWSDEEESFIVRLVADEGLTNEQLYERFCDRFGPDRRTLTSVKKKRADLLDRIEERKAGERTTKPPEDLPDAASEKVEFSVKGDRAWATAIALPRVLTLEELLDVCRVNRAIWEVDRYKVNKWETAGKNEAGEMEPVQLFQVKASLQRRPDAPLILAAEAALEKMADHAPVYPPPPTPDIAPDDRHMLEIVLPDLHLGMLAWHRETGEDYDSRIASDRYRAAIDNLLSRGSVYGIEWILLVIGNDFFHTDTYLDGLASTTAGTPQDVDSRRAKMVETGYALLVETIDKLLGVAPVKVVGVPGNHDTAETMHAARYLKAWYRKCEAVEVDAEPSPRKYHLYGRNLLGFTHGKEEKAKELPTIMAVERPNAWAKSFFREWHLGHIHTKREYHPLYVDEKQGVRVRFLSSLAGTDAWHHRRGYVGNIRAGEAFIWHHDHGLADAPIWNVPVTRAA